MARRTAPADLLRAGALLLTVIVTAGCSGGRHPASPDTARRGVAEQAPSPSGPGPVIPAPQPTAVQRADVDAQIAAMPLDREVGQVFMTYTYGRTATDDDATSVAANETLSGVRDGAELISRYHVGGLLLLDTNPLDNRQPTVETGTTDPNVTAGYTASMQAAAAAAGDPPLLIGVDQEGGTVQRLSKPFPRFPEQALLGRQSDGVSLAQAQGTHLGQQLLPLGVDINFAPVADVLTNPADSAIGTRAFGTTASVVSPRVAAEVRGLGGAGVAATLKHFPGHGSTSVDSHIGLPVVTRSLAELLATDSFPRLTRTCRPRCPQRPCTCCVINFTSTVSSSQTGSSWAPCSAMAPQTRSPCRRYGPASTCCFSPAAWQQASLRWRWRCAPERCRRVGSTMPSVTCFYSSSGWQQAEVRLLLTGFGALVTLPSRVPRLQGPVPPTSTGSVWPGCTR